jgi:3-oxoacyl-[acyl-carrier-protein] synthase II
MTRRRVAITGIGIVSSLGTTREETWSGLLAGACGVGPVTVFDTEGYRSRVAAEVKTPAVQARLTPLERRRLSRGDQFGAVAAAEAIADSGILDDADPRRIGVMLGAGTSDLIRNETYQHTAYTRGIEHARPSEAWNHFSSTPVDVIASRFGLEGPRACVVAACASSTIAIGQAADAVRSGRADAVLAGGTDALARLTFSGFNALRLMDPGPCRPFDKGRVGMNIGEGAAIWCWRSCPGRAGAARGSTASSRDTASRAKRTTRRRPSPRDVPCAASCSAPWATPGSTPAASIT